MLTVKKIIKQRGRNRNMIEETLHVNNMIRYWTRRKAFHCKDVYAASARSTVATRYRKQCQTLQTFEWTSPADEAKAPR